jgi:hypothetical protein
MTTNACGDDISEFVKRRPNISHAVDNELEELASDLSLRIRSKLQLMYLFTTAFLGRIGRIVSFLPMVPMARGIPEIDAVMYGESLTVAMLLIDRQQEKFANGSITDVTQLVSVRTKHQIAKIVIKEAIEEAVVRSIQTVVEQKWKVVC